MGVDVLNAVGLDYVCIGNHESNVGLNHFQKRYSESQFKWLNSNIPSLLPGDAKMLDKDIIIVPGKVSKKVGLFGVVTDDMLSYPKGAFGGAKIEPVLETCKKYNELLKPQVDTVIPLTHLRCAQDRELGALDLGFPVMLAAHDHFLWYEIIKGQHIIKLGMDATHFGTIDVVWRKGADKPSVSVNVHDANMYAPDPDVQKVVDKHNGVLAAMSQAKMAPFPMGVTMSSQAHGAPHTLGTFLATAARDAHKTDLAVIHSGVIRGHKSYDNQSYFTYNDMLVECPTDIPMVVVKMDGKTVRDFIGFARSKQVRPGTFLHVDLNVKFGDNGVFGHSPEWNADLPVTAVMGHPLQDDKMYNVALPYPLIGDEIYGVKPLIAFRKANVGCIPGAEEDAITLQVALIEYWTAGLLLYLVKAGEFPGDAITREELREALSRHHKTDILDLLVDNVMAVGDADGSGTIKKQELIEVAMKNAQLQMVDVDDSGELSRQEVHAMLNDSMGISVTDNELNVLMAQIDPQGTGKVTKQGVIDWILRVRTTNIGVTKSGNSSMLDLPDIMLSASG
eukprot:NODE_311_length_1812_cov_353.359047_g252_i0.p1 GENE.NODE_311_length_1812_cov_353.359047_g252_i0~~NODE_311_length_1812_cov_353.359047_g252_i0.p1  ORF type:complete len:563 (+),score=161.02 NODE_311_length_1812_cov_353.359047_g252_i0:45-1733(+)